MRVALYIIGLTLLVMTGCRKHTQADYEIALKNGVTSLDVTREFKYA